MIFGKRRNIASGSEKATEEKDLRVKRDRERKMGNQKQGETVQECRGQENIILTRFGAI